MRYLFLVLLAAPVCDPEPEPEEGPCENIGDANGDGCPEAVCSPADCPPECDCMLML